MPYISKNRLYTDQNPLAPDYSGKVLEEGDTSARFTLVGEGSTLSDEDAEKYGLVGYKGVSKVQSDGDGDGESVGAQAEPTRELAAEKAATVKDEPATTETAKTAPAKPKAATKTAAKAKSK